MITFFIEHGTGDPESEAEGLISAAKAGKFAFVRFFVKAGVNVSVKVSNLGDLPDIGYFLIILNIGSGSPNEVENETVLYWTVKAGELDMAQLLVDYGADVNVIRREYVTGIWNYDTDEMYIDLPHEYVVQIETGESMGNLEVVRRLEKEEKAYDILVSMGHKSFADKLAAYTDGTKLPGDTIANLRKYWGKKEFDQCYKVLERIHDKKYSKRDTELMRNVCYWTATDYYINKDFQTAILLFHRALKFMVSNQDQLSSLEELKQADISAWKREGEANAPGYYCAYNIACAYSRLGNTSDGLRWLAIAIRLNPGLKNLAKKDSDLKAIRGTGRIV